MGKQKILDIGYCNILFSLLKPSTSLSSTRSFAHLLLVHVNQTPFECTSIKPAWSMVSWNYSAPSIRLEEQYFSTGNLTWLKSPSKNHGCCIWSPSSLMKFRSSFRSFRCSGPYIPARTIKEPSGFQTWICNQCYDSCRGLMLKPSLHNQQTLPLWSWESKPKILL